MQKQACSETLKCSDKSRRIKQSMNSKHQASKQDKLEFSRFCNPISQWFQKKEEETYFLAFETKKQELRYQIRRISMNQCLGSSYPKVGSSQNGLQNQKDQAKWIKDP